MIGSYIYDAVRTPFGRYGKSLADIRPDDLAASALRSLIDRHPSLDPERIDDVLLGDANQSGEDNRNVARMAVLLAGLPTTVPGTTVNRLCGSSLESVIQASRAVESGDAALMIAGGVESMSRAPWILPKPSLSDPSGHGTLYSSTLGWRMVNSRMPSNWTVSNGEIAEMLADRFRISRHEQDEFAVRSHRLADAAWSDGHYDAEIVTLPGTALVRDEGIRPESTIDSLADLKPAFRENGSVTAGNSSPLNDGASMIIVGGVNAIDTEPLARIIGRGIAGNEPDLFGIAPVIAANRALARAGKNWDDVDLVELNEAFAAQSIACLRLWPELDPDKANVHGGALAIGHPLGASGARIVGHLAHELKRRGGGVGLAAICIGVGQGLAIVIER